MKVFEFERHADRLPKTAPGPHGPTASIIQDSAQPGAESAAVHGRVTFFPPSVSWPWPGAADTQEHPITVSAISGKRTRPTNGMSR